MFKYSHKWLGFVIRYVKCLNPDSIYVFYLYYGGYKIKHLSLKSPTATFFFLNHFERMYHPQWKCLGWLTIGNAKKERKDQDLKKTYK